MIFHMFSMIGANNEIFLAVVLLVIVFVMNLFTLSQSPSNGGLCNNDVFKNVAFSIRSWVSWDEYFLVAFFKDVRLFFVRCTASPRAVFWRLVMRDELFAAMLANVWFGRCVQGLGFRC